MGPQSGSDSSTKARKGRHVISVRRHLTKNRPSRLASRLRFYAWCSHILQAEGFPALGGIQILGASRKTGFGRRAVVGASLSALRNLACRELTGRVIIDMVTPHHWWCKTGVLSVTSILRYRLEDLSCLLQHAGEVDLEGRVRQMCLIHRKCCVFFHMIANSHFGATVSYGDSTISLVPVVSGTFRLNTGECCFSSVFASSRAPTWTPHFPVRTSRSMRIFSFWFVSSTSRQTDN